MQTLDSGWFADEKKKKSSFGGKKNTRAKFLWHRSRMFSFNYPNYRDFSFLHLSACRADHIAAHEACNHAGHTLREACTYCRRWPGLRELWAPPETRISRRSLRGAEWEREGEEEEKKSWRLSGNGSRWMKDIRDNEVKQSEHVWRWIFLSASLLLLLHGGAAASNVVLIMARSLCEVFQGNLWNTLK